ncbi:hypothetical protein TNCV_1838031 [Trichonephila clavipes]|nr:hypothetical protein TNCV_1838031 [Trichonephila clavipes]
MFTLIGLKIIPEAHSFTIKRDNIWIDHSELRDSDATKQARTARLEERSSQNAIFEVEEGSMQEAGITD